MKTILIDAVGVFVSRDGIIFDELHKLLEKYPNPKIILTNADYEADDKYHLKNMPYEVFTLRHDPKKTDPAYYISMLDRFGLTANNVVYFEHNPDAVKSARSVGIKTYHYDPNKKDLEALKKFLDENRT